MNEKIPVGSEMAENDLRIEQVIRTILDNALKTRPEVPVYYQPFLPCPFAGFTRHLGSIHVDLDKMYPACSIGDGVMTDFHIRCTKDEEIFLNVLGSVKVWYRDTLIYSAGHECDEWAHLPISVKKDDHNPVRILCQKQENCNFAFDFLISVKRYPSMWANDYLFGARAIIPTGRLRGEEGIAISHILPAEACAAENLGDAVKAYAWPPCMEDDDTIHFDRMSTDDSVWYVYSQAAEDQALQTGDIVDKAWVNRSLVNPVGGYIHLQKGDQLLLRCNVNKTTRQLTLKTNSLVLPFLRSNRGVQDKIMMAGPFYGMQCHGPEYEWDLSTVFTNQKGEKIYWQFSDGSQLRIYLDSIFWGQWFYALMVGFYGIRDAAIYLKDNERQQLFCRNMRMLAKYFPYIEFDIQNHKMPAFMPRIAEMNVLDNIGTMGMNLIDAYLDSNDPILLPLIERIKDQAEHTIPRLDDGTYFRNDTMWADDLYMSCPFLVRMGVLTGDSTWFQKAADQIKGFKKKQYMEDEKLFSHIWFPNTNCANRVPWGRGNGWVMWTLTELLMRGAEHIDLTEEKQLFCDMAHRLQQLQDESGLWHQVLNRDEAGSYLETSCTGMFLLAFTRGVRYGWLEDDFLKTIEKAWAGLLRHSIDVDGNVYGVCMGSGCSMEAEYYYTIPTTVNDDHGTGVILAAASEYWALQTELEAK